MSSRTLHVIGTPWRSNPLAASAQARAARRSRRPHIADAASGTDGGAGVSVDEQAASARLARQAASLFMRAIGQCRAPAVKRPASRRHEQCRPAAASALGEAVRIDVGAVAPCLFDDAGRKAFEHRHVRGDARGSARRRRQGVDAAPRLSAWNQSRRPRSSITAGLRERHRGAPAPENTCMRSFSAFARSNVARRSANNRRSASRLWNTTWHSTPQ